MKCPFLFLGKKSKCCWLKIIPRLLSVNIHALLYEPDHSTSYIIAYALSERANPPTHLRSLIKVFTEHSVGSQDTTGMVNPIGLFFKRIIKRICWEKVNALAS